MEPSDWATFEKAQQALSRHTYEGIGYVFSEENDIVGIDLDKVIDATGQKICPKAQEIVNRLDSYTEVSPSGTGLHIFVKVKGNHKGRKGSCGGIIVEMYTQARYFTVTGVRWPGTPATVEERTDEFQTLYKELSGESVVEDLIAGSSESFPARERDLIPDMAVLKLARNEKNGDKFKRLFDDGDISDYDDDDSRADLALCSKLAFYCGKDGHEQVERLMYASALFREKYDSARGDTTYLRGTIYKAYEGKREADFYSPHRVLSVQSQTKEQIGEGDKTLKTLKTLERNRKMISIWPEALPEEAHYGLVGKVLKTLAPHTEADSTALLVQFLVAFGNRIGRKAFFKVGATKHHTNLFCATVGQSSRGRKGTGLDLILALFSEDDGSTGWVKTCIKGGLASGEGLVYHVRDDRTEHIYDKRKKEYEAVMVPGVSDKRLLDKETEFAGVLQVMERDTNKLSSVLREAWDSGNLKNLTKTNPDCATDAHISIVGHITREELLQCLNKGSNLFNGFANRFLWICSERSKLLPEGGNLPESDIVSLRQVLHEVIAFASSAGEIKRDEGARALWCEIYPTLTEDREGVLGHVTSRAEAQVLRLSMLYALLDKSETICTAHLKAALAVWQYCDASAAFIFGTSLGNKDSEKVLSALRSTEGMSRKDIRDDVFQKHITTARLTTALELLQRNGLATCTKEETDGRPREFWTIIHEDDTEEEEK